MTGQKSLEGGGGGGGIGGGGLHPCLSRPEMNLEHFQGQEAGGGAAAIGGGGGNKLVSWIGRLTGAQATASSSRRGSLGFSTEIHLSGAPLSRMDEDSLSNQGSGAIGSGAVKGSIDIADKRRDFSGLPFGRKRDISFSDLQTPGGDGDTFFPSHYKRRAGDMNQEAGQSFSMDTDKSEDGGLMMGLSSSILVTEPQETSRGTLNTPRTMPGRVAGSGEKDALTAFHYGGEDNKDAVTASHYGVGVQFGQPDTNTGKSPRDSKGIFLIDIEPADQKSGNKIKATTKKFSMSKLFEGKWAQNWFFRKDSSCGEPPDLMNEDAMDQESPVAAEQHQKNNSSGGEAVKSQHKRTPSADSNASSSEESDQPLSFVGRFKGEGGGGGGVVHPRALREMNTWTPQGM